MEVTLILFFIILISAALLGYAQSGTPPKVGAPAPDFRLPDQDGRGQALTDYQGKRVVLHFFPMDDTPETLAVVKRFNALRSALEATRAELLTIAVTDCEKAQEYATEREMFIPILCDVDGKIAKAYGALIRLGPLRFARKMTLILDDAGKVQKVFRDITSPDHVDELLRALG